MKIVTKYLLELEEHEKKFLKLVELHGDLYIERDGVIGPSVVVLEHIINKNIDGTANSYREDPANTNTKTSKHAHIYAKKNGGGRELYSVNVDGRGHDGSSGVEISAKHADFFRKRGYKIPLNNVLESLAIDLVLEGQFCPIFVVPGQEI